MNVKYTEINTADAARMFGVTTQAVSSWCRKGLINHVNLSDGNQRGRYMLTENECNYIKELIKEHGARKFMMYYKKDREDAVNVYHSKKEQVQLEHYPVFNPVAPVKEESKKETSMNADQVTNKIMRIQDIKEELEDLDARKNQLNNELEMLRDEIMDWI